MQAGTYTNDFPGYIHGLTIEGVGGLAVLTTTAGNSPGNGKAYLDVLGNTTLKNLDISGVSVPDQNGAAVRYESGNLRIENSVLHGNQNGLLTAADPNGTIGIERSEIYGNGIGDGHTHNLYVSAIAQFTLTNSYVHDANVGHEVKSRAANNTITNNRIFDNSSTASYSIDLPNGGNATISGNVIEQGPNTDNGAIVAYGEEGASNGGNQVTFTDNTVRNDHTGSSALFWNTSGASISASGNTVYGLTASELDWAGTVSGAGFTFTGTPPALDTTSPVNSGEQGGSNQVTPGIADTAEPSGTVSVGDNGVGTASTAAQAVAGTEVADGTVTLSGGGVSLGTGPVDGTSASVTSDAGASGLAATGTVAGEVSVPSNPVTPTPDTTPASVPVIAGTGSVADTSNVAGESPLATASSTPTVTDGGTTEQAGQSAGTIAIDLGKITGVDGAGTDPAGLGRDSVAGFFRGGTASDGLAAGQGPSHAFAARASGPDWITLFEPAAGPGAGHGFTHVGGVGYGWWNAVQTSDGFGGVPTGIPVRNGTAETDFLFQLISR